MQVGDVAQIVTVVVAVATAVGLIIRDRRKPQLDEAQTAAIKNEVAKTSRDLNLARDLRTLDLEVWGDAMRPYISAINRRDDQMLQLLVAAYDKLEMPMPNIVPLPAMPKFPEPRPLP